MMMRNSMDKTYNLSLTLEEIKLVSGALVELQSKVIADRSWVNSQIIKGKKEFTPMLEKLLVTEGNINRTLEKVHRAMLEEKWYIQVFDYRRRKDCLRWYLWAKNKIDWGKQLKNYWQYLGDVV